MQNTEDGGLDKVDKCRNDEKGIIFLGVCVVGGESNNIIEGIQGKVEGLGRQ